jgi:hypothetical protein
MIRLLVAALVVVTACKQREEPPAPARTVPAMSAAEVQRSEDACKAYVERVCACGDKVPDGKRTCELARALPEAVRLGLEIAASPESKPNDVLGAQGSVRKAVKQCIEQTAKLPALGCP